MKKSKIEWKGKDYIVREVNLPEKWGYNNPVDVAEEDLWKEIEDSYNNGDKKAESIDNSIFFYCETDFIKSDPTDEELINYIEKYGF